MSQKDGLMFWGGKYSLPVTKTNVSDSFSNKNIRATIFDYEIKGGDALKSK